MALCWPLQMPPTSKAVLIALADQANDQGSCWPSIAGIAERTCFGRTAVIAALQWLEDRALISAEKQHGRNNRYQIDLSALAQPVRETDQSAKRTSPADGLTSPRDGLPPVREADQPVRQADPNHQEPSLEPSITEEPPAEADAPKSPVVRQMTVEQLVAEGLREETAIEFLAHRKTKKARLTPLAWKGIVKQAGIAGFTVEAACVKAIERNWQSFDASFVADDKKRDQPYESGYSKSMRMRVAEISPTLAAKAPSKPYNPEFEVIDVDSQPATRLLG